MGGTKSNPAKPKSVRKRRAAALQTKTLVKRARRRMLGGIPLKRKLVWAYDIDSAEFKAAWRRDIEAIKAKDRDRDGMQWVEAVLALPEVQEWWR